MNHMVRRLLAAKTSLVIATILLLTWLLLINRTILPGVSAVNLASGPGAILEPDNNGVGYPGTILIYTHTLTNTGEDADTFTLTVSSSAAFAVSVTPFTRTLARDEATPITVTVTIPEDALAGLDTSVVTATSTIEPAVVANATNTTLVMAQYGVIIAPDNSGSGNPGQTIPYTHIITNTGNADDTFTIQAVSELSFPVTLAPSSVPLAAGAGAYINITVTIPGDASADKPETTVVTATSTADSTVYAAATNVTTVNPIDNITFGPNNESVAYPGETVVYTHTLTNDGNRSNTVSLAGSSSRGYAVTVVPESITLEQNQSAMVTATVAIPIGTPTGQDITTVTASPLHGAARTATNTTTIRHWQLFLPMIVRPAEWQTAGSEWPEGMVARSLAVCAGNSDLMVAGTIDNGAWLRNGAGWSKAPAVPDGHSVTNAVIDQACDRAYVSLFNQGVWQGSRSGTVWTWAQLGGAEVKEARALTLVGATLYVGGEFGIRYWQDSAWQTTNISNAGSQPIMHLSAANPLTNSGPAYAIQWQSNKILRSTASPATWEEVPLPALPDVLTRAVFGTTDGIHFVGTNNQSFRLQSGAWQLLNVSAGLRSAAPGSNRSYLGYAAGAGVYELFNDQLTPLTNGWSTVPEFVYELRLVGGKLYAATSTGVWAYSVP
jgi:hypothetical protein